MEEALGAPLGSDIEIEECSVDLDRQKRSRESEESTSDGVEGFVDVKSKRKAKKIKNTLQDTTSSVEKIAVYVTSKECLPKQFGMAKLLQSENICNISKIVHKNPYKVVIEFESRSDCDKLLKCSRFESLGYRCQLADEINLTYGLVRQVDLDITEEEAAKTLNCEQEIVAVRRLKRLSQEGKWVESETIRLSFKGSTLPPYVFGYGCRFKVEPYTFPVSQCSQCWHFGHLARACPHRVACPKCGGDHQNCDTNKFKCVNCGGPHWAMDKQCPIFLKEKEIRRMMCAQNCTYRVALNSYLDKRSMVQKENSTMSDARRPIKEANNSGTQSYSDVVKTRPADKMNNTESGRVANMEKEDVKNPQMETKKQKKRKRCKSNTEGENEVEGTNTEESKEDLSEDSSKKEGNLVQMFYRLVNKVKRVFDSDNSFEDKLKSSLSIIVEEGLQFLLKMVDKDFLLKKLVSFLSNYG